jgi:hypothetical protein
MTIIKTLVGQTVRVTTVLGKVVIVNDVHKTSNGHIVGYREADGALVHIGWSDMGSCTPEWISDVQPY